MKTSYFSIKKCIIYFTIIVMIVLLSIYAYRWYEVYTEEQTRESYLIKTNTISLEISNLEDLNSIDTESPSNYFIYVGYKNDKDELNLEKKLKKIIDDYGLNDIFYYFDATKLIDDKDFIDELNKSLSIEDKYITNVPSIIYVKENSINKKNIINSSKNKLFSINDFENLLKKNEIEKISQ